MNEDTSSAAGAGDNLLRHRLLWPGLIVALLGGQIVLVLVMVYLATSDGTFAIEPDYYRKGLLWDATAAQLRENQRLGWDVWLEVEPDVDVLGQRILSCRLSDESGQLLGGAAIEVMAFPHVRGTERQTVSLAARADGTYAAPMRFGYQGVWEFRLTVRRGAQTFTYSEQRDVYPPGESRPWRR